MLHSHKDPVPAEDAGLSRFSEQKRRQILEAAARLFLRDGFEATTMDAIAHEADVSKATVYAHALKIARKHLLLFCLLFFGTMVSAVAAVVIPVTLVLLTSWSIAIKAVLLLMLGSVYIAGTAWVFLVLFSEDHWMKLSGVQDLLDDIYSSDSKF